MRTTKPDHVDVLILGAGLSGIGAACHLQRRCPGKTYAILEARDAIGGTWDLFRYPGVRSDSDMHTLGYSFRPWKAAKAIADGPSILRYITETADQFGVTEQVRLGHRVLSADWSSAQMRWRVSAQRTDTGELVQLTAGFLLACTGYYRYDRGYAPQLEGAHRFQGPIVHPQQWPQDIDFAGKRVVVIGSGATAVTLVPAMARTAGHVTMLQRSPSYMVTLPERDEVAVALRRLLPAMAAHHAVRIKNIALLTLTYQLSRHLPRLSKALIRRDVQRQLPDGFDVDTHFKPPYEPWDQRLCVCPDGDLFRALSDGRASIVTGQIETLTERGIVIEGGTELEADLLVTATGLDLVALGGVDLAVDGVPLDVPSQTIYKGTMLSGVPNAAMTFGYTNASWTLKCDLICEYVCRLLRHMDEHGYRQVVALQDDPSLTFAPFFNLTSGYVLRSAERFPRQGSRRPWRMYQNYAFDVMALRFGELEDGVLRFSRSAVAAQPAVVAAAA
jgi:cation diffusion facilitator CzcD-associated flavoprotein CzcO